jgi:hypothetical protein
MMRKKVMIVAIFVILSAAAYAQQSDWLWAVRAGSSGTDNGRGMAVDDQGNQYVTGIFAGSVSFGTTTLTSSGLRDVFIAKSNPEGIWLWAKKAGGTGDDMGRKVAVDNVGNVYITGHFPGTATFGTSTLTSSGSYDIFVAKLDGSGNWLWAISAGGSGADNSYCITLDDSNNIYVTGLFSGTSSFGSSSVSSAGGYDVYIAKLNTSGTWQWVKRAGGSGADYGYGVAADVEGNVYLSGFFNDTAGFGTTNLSSYGSSDIFTAKLNSNGSWLWAKQAGGPGDDASIRIATDHTGDVYVTGYFSSTASFEGISLTSSGNTDVFVAKLDAAGNYVWASQAGGTAGDDASQVVLDNDNYIYVSGIFQGSANFGDETLTSDGDDDVYVAKLDCNGNWINAFRAGGSGTDDCNGLGVDAAGNVYITGFFSNTASFGPTALTSAGGYDIFVAKRSAPKYALELYSTPSNALIYKDGISTGYCTPHTFIDIEAELIGSYTVFVSDYYFDPITITDISSAQTINFQGYYVGSNNINWTWVTSAGGSGVDTSYSISTDDNGNSYVTGDFYGTTTFGSTTLVSNGQDDVFVAKLDLNGNWLWAVQAGGTSYDRSYAIISDGAGNSYITGYFYGTATFGSTTLTSSGSSDTFIAKLDSFGNWLWAKKAGGSSNQWGRSISSDSSGNLYITGLFRGTSTFGSATLTSDGDYDAFVAKAGPSGDWLWARKAGGTGTDGGYGISTDGSGNTYVTGYFSDTSTFGTFNLTSNGLIDIFISKLDTVGNWLWAVGTGSLENDIGISISTDGTGNPYVTGYFGSTVSFGSTTLTSRGTQDVYVSKLDTAGNWLWTASAGGIEGDWGNCIYTDNSGNSYLTGDFTNQAIFGQRIVSADGVDDVFMAKLDSLGNWLWVDAAGGDGGDTGHGVALSVSGDVYFTGSFINTAHFGAIDTTSQGENDVFIAKLPATYSLLVTSTPSGAPILKEGTPTGFLTPHTFADTASGLAGTYIAALDYHLFEPITITGISQDTTISFSGTYADPPTVLTAIGPVIMYMDQSHDIDALESYFSSIDPNISYTVLGNTHIDWNVGAPHTITLAPEPGWYGTEYVTIRATDSWGRYEQQNVRITVWETWTTTEEFDHEGSLPLDWTTTHGGTTGFPWQPVLTTDGDYEMKTKATLGGTANERLLSALYDLSPYEEIQVSFDTDYLPYGTGTGTFAYSLNNITYTTVDVISSTFAGQKTYAMPALDGKPMVKFRWSYVNTTPNTGQDNHWIVDDFNIYARMRDLTPPNAITGFSVQNLTQTSATLAWNPSFDVYFGCYKIYLSSDPEITTTDMLWSVANDPLLNNDATSQTTVSNLAPGEYWAAIMATDISGNDSDFSTAVSFLIDDSPPVFSEPLPGGQPEPAWSQSQNVTIGCHISDASALDPLTLAYRLDYNRNGVYDDDEAWIMIDSRMQGGIRSSRDDLTVSLGLNLSEDGIYAWETKVADVIGNCAHSGCLGLEGITDDWMIRVDATPPAPIDYFFVQNVADNSVQLSWTASMDLYFAGYRIWYSTSPELGPDANLWDPEDDPALAYAGTGLLSTTVTGLIPSTRYHFILQALDEAGWITQYPSSVTGMTSSSVPPTAPQNVSLNISGNQLVINWDEVNLDINGNPIGVSYYEVHASDRPNFQCSNETLLDTVEGTELVLDGVLYFADRLFFKVITVSGAIRDQGSIRPTTH